VGSYRRWGWGLGIATVTAVSAFGIASWQANAAPGDPSPGVGGMLPKVSDPDPVPEAAAGTGSDALTSTEVDKARAAALTPKLAAEARGVTGEAGPEYLSADLGLDGGREAELYFYDYKTDKLIKQVVDLGTGKLAHTYSAAGMQLPATPREATAALDLLLADPLGDGFKTAYAEATGKPFASKDGLVATAHIYKAKAADTGASQCGKKRCVQLIVQTGDGQFINVTDVVVDLSGRKVARLS
jgi:hypothetical protein